MTCHLVSALHAFRCATGHGSFVFVRPVVVAGRLSLKVIGLVA